MTDCFLFFRCWPGFSEPFPFEQFNALPDDELLRALDGFVGEQIQIPGVRKQIKEVGRGRRRRFVNALNDKWKRRSPGSKPVTRWMGHAFRQKCWRRVRGAGREDPKVCRLGAYLGWWTYTKVNGRLVGFPVVWFCLSPSLALAEHLVEELNRQRCLDYDKHDLEYLANPRYSFVSAEGLSLGKRASILRCINAIREGREPDVQGAKLALLIGQRSLRVALDVAEAWPIDEDNELLAALPPPAPEPQPPAVKPADAAGGGDGHVEETEPRQTPAAAGNKGDTSMTDPFLTVSKWEELGIGIDADGKYLAITPAPEFGAVFPREKAVAIDLPGKQWESLLDLFACSENGDTADKQDVMLAFGYLEKGMGNPEDYEELIRDQRKMKIIKAAPGRLTAAVKDLGRKLRAKANVNEQSSNNPVLSVKENQFVRARFVVRHLVRDGNGKLVFGSAT